jgi:hypothetical protein
MPTRSLMIGVTKRLAERTQRSMSRTVLHVVAPSSEGVIYSIDARDRMR